MKHFVISIAGIPVGVNPLYSETRNYFLDYLCREKPAVIIEIQEKDILFERVQSSKLHANCNDNEYSDRYLETLAILRKIATELVEFNIVLFHGVAVVAKDQTYIFTAASGVGKTTHAMLWLKALPHSYVLNGDKPFLKVSEDGKILACGGPWRGKEQHGVNRIKPVRSVCFLERAERNDIHEIGAKEAIKDLIKRTYLPDDKDLLLKTLELLGVISHSIRFYRLGCNMDSEAAAVSIGAMIGDDC